MDLLPSPGVFTDFLLSAYNRALDGIPVIGSAIDLASKYRRSDQCIHARINALIRAQSAIAAQNGFLLGLPGAIFAPVSIPVDIAQSMYLQLRMVAAIEQFDFKIIYSHTS